MLLLPEACTTDTSRRDPYDNKRPITTTCVCVCVCTRYIGGITIPNVGVGGASVTEAAGDDTRASSKT